MNEHKSKITPVENMNGYDPFVAALAGILEELSLAEARKGTGNEAIHVSAEREPPEA